MLGTIYRLFVTTMVLALLGVFLYMDHVYKTDPTIHGKSVVASTNSPEAVVDASNNGQPINALEEVQESRFAQRLLDQFDDVTVVDAVESVGSDGILVRKEVMLTQMKYPLIRREIHFQMDETSGEWVPIEGHAYVADQVMMGLNDGETLESLDPILHQLNAEIIQSFEGGNHFLLRFKSRDVDSVDEAISTLKLYSFVDYAEPNYLRVSTYIPNDSRFGELWALDNQGGYGGRLDADIDAPEAWGITFGERSVIVAVTDTGIDNSHPDLQESIYRNSVEVLNGLDDDHNGYVDDVAGWNFSAEDNGNNNTQDYSASHGTHVSGIIAAKGDNNQGVIGVAPGVSLLPVKVLDENGGFLSDFINGIDYSISMGASIINVSLGGNDFSLAEKTVFDRAEAKGVLVVVAAGNEGQDVGASPEYPGGYDNDNIINVLASNRLDQFEPFSSYGASAVDVAAPGRQILSTFLGNDYRFFKGTSMSAAHVSGIAALVKSVNPSWRAPQLKEAIMNTVDQQPSLIGRCVSGGRVNAYKAVCYAAERSFFPTGSQVAIRSDVNLRYVNPDPAQGNQLVASGMQIGDRQIFYSYKVSPGRYAFQSFANGLFVTAGTGGNEPLAASRASVTEWEIFAPLLTTQTIDTFIASGSGTVGGGSPLNPTLVDSGPLAALLINGDQYAFRASANSRIVTAGDASNPLMASRTTIGQEETFTVEAVRPLPPGRRIVLQSAVTGQFVSFNEFGQLVARDSVAGMPNIFKVGLTEDGYITLKSVVLDRYVSAGAGPMSANSLEIGDAEKFLGLHYAQRELEQVLLRSKGSGGLVSLSDGQLLIANGQQPDPLEAFNLHLLPN